MGPYELMNNGHITLESDAALIQGVASTNTGMGTYEVIRTAPQNKNQFRFLSSPIDNINIQNVYGGSNVAQFDPANHAVGNGWTYLSNGTLENARGYAVNGSNLLNGGEGRRHYIGNVNNGIVSIPIDGTIYGSPYDGWNLIGNPYPSAVSITALMTSNPSLGSVTLYDQSNSNYITYNSINAAGAKIASGEAFYTHFIGPNTNINFDNSHRLEEVGAMAKNSSTSLSSLTIRDEDEAEYTTHIAFTDKASDTFDLNYDAPLIPQANQLSLFSSLENESYAIQSFAPVKNNKKVIVGIEGKAGNYTIELSQYNNFTNDIKVILTDKLSGKKCDLLKEAYTFYKASDEKVSNRFEITYQKEKTLPTSELNDINTNCIRNYITLEATDIMLIDLVKLYDLNGKLISSWKHVDLSNQQQKLQIELLPPGNYILELYLQETSISKKLNVTH